jgi:hypothetical protein
VVGALLYDPSRFTTFEPPLSNSNPLRELQQAYDVAVRVFELGAGVEQRLERLLDIGDMDVFRTDGINECSATLVDPGSNDRALLGCKQRIRSAVNDRICIEPNP